MNQEKITEFLKERKEKKLTSRSGADAIDITCTSVYTLLLILTFVYFVVTDFFKKIDHFYKAKQIFF